jgi:hypothetical protein
MPGALASGTPYITIHDRVEKQKGPIYVTIEGAAARLNPALCTVQGASCITYRCPDTNHLSIKYLTYRMSAGTKRLAF